MEPVAKPSTSPIDLSTTSGVERAVFSRECEVKMEYGLHARPSVMLIKLSKHFVSVHDGASVEFKVGDYCVNPAQGFLAMLSLVAGTGSVIVASVRGLEPERAREFLDAVQSLVGHPCPEEAIYASDATQQLSLAPAVVEALRRSISDDRRL